MRHFVSKLNIITITFTKTVGVIFYPKNRKKTLMKNKKIICIIAAVALMVAAVFCDYRIYSHYAQVDEQTEVFDELLLKWKQSLWTIFAN